MDPPTSSHDAPRRSRARVWLTLLFAAGGAAIGAVMATSAAGAGHAPVPADGVACSPMALCLYCWVGLSVYWSLAARGASAARAAESSRSRARHLSLITAAQLLAFWPFAGWPFAAPLPLAFPRMLPDWPWLGPAGVTVTVAGLALAVVSRRALGRHWSGEVTVKVGHELVRSGPYRRIRHPIYTGVIAMYVGPALVSGRWQGAVSLALVAVAYARKILQEERVLRREFGAAYDDYRRAAGALLLRLR